MSIKSKYGSIGLIAGGSEGIGAAFAHYLAREGLDLILVARRKEKLEAFGTSLTEEYGVQVDCIACDLAQSNAAQQIESHLKEKTIDLFVYNAALSYIGKFEENDLEHHNKIAQANMVTPMNLVQAVAKPMLQRGRGAIILMASLAGFQGSGFLAAYAATKAFNRVFAESLWYEWKGRGVDVIACCAGATSTPNFINTKPEKTSAFAPKVQQPKDVVKECFRYLGKKPSCITGSGNRFASFLMQRLMPRKMAINIMGDTTKKMYRL